MTNLFLSSQPLLSLPIVLSMGVAACSWFAGWWKSEGGTRRGLTRLVSRVAVLSL